MNILALQIKANTAEEVGRDLEKSYKKLEKELLRLQGALDYLAKIEKELNQVAQRAKEDVLGENATANLTDPLEAAKYVIEKIMECSSKVHEHMERISLAIPITEGKKEGVNLALKNLHSIYKSNKDRVTEIEKELTTGKAEVDGRGNITAYEGEGSNLPHHPGLSVKGEKIEEELKEKAKKKKAEKKDVVKKKTKTAMKKLKQSDIKGRKNAKNP